MNISELTMQAIKDERAQLKTRVQKLSPLVEASFDLPGIDSSTTLGSGGLMLFCHGSDWRPAYRALRQVSGQRPYITIYPGKVPSTRASVNLEFPIGETRVTLNFDTDDYQKFLKAGSNCRRESISDKIVCSQ